MKMQNGMKPVGHRDCRNEEIEIDVARREKDVGNARQRIELLNERRQLQQALMDAFDF